jgi:hypothetical protein
MKLLSRWFGRWRKRRGGTLRHEPPVVARRAPYAGSRRATETKPARSSDAFTPTRPKSGRQLIGRETELARILQAIDDEQAHVVLYSERGRGKTSLSNVVAASLRKQNYIVARNTCEASSTFDTVMRGLVRELPASLLAVPSDNPAADEGCSAAFPRDTLYPRDVATLMSRLNCQRLVCVIDEFDRIEDVTTRIRVADTIKQISDRGAMLTLMIVGVSENLEQILGQHPSIQRNVVAVHLPLLNDAEIAAMLTKGGRDCGIVFPVDVVAHVTVIARGMPHMAQLLGLRITQSVVARGSDTAGEADMVAAIDRVLSDSQYNVGGRYADLTNNGNDTELVDALRSVATAVQDRWGRVTVESSADAVLVGGREISARAWQAFQSENILHATPDSTTSFAIADRALIYHVLLSASRRAMTDSVPESLVAPQVIAHPTRRKFRASTS